MGWRRELSKIRALFRRQNPAQELDEEIRSHLRMEEQENLEAGLSPKEAHYRAMQRFGNIPLAKERSKEMWQWTSVEGFLQDLRFGFRQLRNNPGFAAIAILTLALGIGANSAMFSLIDGVLLKPLPFHQPDRLVNLWEVTPKRNLPPVPPPVGNYLDWRKMNHSLASIAAFTQAAFSLTSTSEPERYIGALCDEGLFPTLGVAPALGRAFTADDNLPGRDTVAILSDGFWKRRFGGDPHILGQQIILDGRSRTIVGVMPEGFSFPPQSVVWTPFGWSDELRSRRDWHDIRAIGRLKDGVSLTQAQADFSAIAANLARQYPVFNQGELIKVAPLMEDIVGQIRPAFLILLAAVGFVLLTACANVANLLLAKAAERARELAVRASLGAGRARILRQLLVESLLLSLTGGLAGLVLAVVAIRTVVATAPASIPRLTGIHLDWPVVLFTLGLSLLTGIVFGIAPAWSASRADVHSVLKEGARGTTKQGGLRGTLVVAQVIAAVVLLAGAGLLVRSFYSLLQVDAGFNAEHVMTARLVPAPSKYNDHPDLQIQLARNILHNVAALPGVENSAIGSDIPIAGNPNFIMRMEGQEVTPSQAPVTAFFSVTPAYFDAMGMRLVEGRLLNDRDVAGTPFVAVVNQTLAHKFFPGQSAIGKRIEVTFRTPPRWREIVGVVADVHIDGLDMAAPVQVYGAFLQIPGASLAFTPAMSVVVKTKQDPAVLGAELKEAIYRADRSQPVFALQTMREVVGKSVGDRRFALLLIAAFAALALFLAALGIYGVISYSVTQRTPEIGIRMALGAKASQVVWMIERQGLILVSIGLLCGILAALGMTRFVKGMLFGIRPADPFTFLCVAGLLLAVALVASYLPAWRASRIDPINALRHE
jgi:predicted permease